MEGLKAFLLICIVPVYIIGWAGAMTAMDLNQKDAGRNPPCFGPDVRTSECAGQFLIGAAWPAILVAAPVYHVYRSFK